jgi:predicted amidohydrolase YtcJ
LTINGARQYSEQDRKGSISVGKLADLVILNRNPLEVDPERILGQLRIEETISHGKTIYRRRAQ